MKAIKINAIIFLCTLLSTQTTYPQISFDSLFPMTWYQKGLESSLYSWQALTTMLENNDNQKMFDILGRLTFIQFCVDQMQQENKFYAADDIDYFLAVVYKIQQLLMMVIPSSTTEDFVMCADILVLSIQEKLKVIS